MTESAVAPPATWMQWLDVAEPWEFWWVGFGLLAQMVFFGRWIVQWIASERRGRSHVPTLFWWLSLVGATMLLVYFIGRREPVGALGQLIGWTVYTRNLHLIRVNKRRIVDDVPPERLEPTSSSERLGYREGLQRTSTPGAAPAAQSARS